MKISFISTTCLVPVDEVIFFKFQYLKLRALQRKSYTHYFYEATVGAGLPIISTLRGLLETGDKILKIEGIFRSVVFDTKFASFS